MIEISEIERMSLPDRLQMMERLWKSISRKDTDVTSPAWHGQVLAARKAKIERGEGKFLSLEQLKARLRSRKP